MKVIDLSKSIAESMDCVFYQGTLNELNIDLDQGLIDVNQWIFGFVSPPNLEDETGEAGDITTTYPYTAYIVKRLPNPTNEYRTKDVQPTVDEALLKARYFTHKFIEDDNVVIDKSVKVKYPAIYGQFDLHLFGVGIDADFLVNEGLTGCEYLTSINQ